jgi:hypothetical protein
MHLRFVQYNTIMEGGGQGRNFSTWDKLIGWYSTGSVITFYPGGLARHPHAPVRGTGVKLLPT